MKVEEILDVFKLPVLMLEEAPLAIRAVKLLVECSARLRLVLIVIDRRRLSHELVFSMSKLAFVAVSAEPDFDPVLAHLCLVLRLINFLQLLLL